MTDRARHRRGFTLIEMLAAVALASLLLTALFAVATSISRSEQHLAAQATAGDRHEALVRLLRTDLSLARRMRFDDGHLTLDGYGRLDAETLSPNHQPAVVEYGIAAVGDRRVLVRAQTPADGDAAIRLLEVGVVMFDVQPDGQPSDPPEDWRPESVRLTLVIRTRGNDESNTFERRIVLP